MAENAKHTDKQDKKGFAKGKKEAPRKTVNKEVSRKTGQRKR